MQATVMRPMSTPIDVEDPGIPLGLVPDNATVPDRMATVLYLTRDENGPPAEDVDEILSARCACL